VRPVRRELVERIALIAVALVAIAAIVARHQGSPAGRQFAQVIAFGADGDLDEAGAAQDQNLADEEKAAGQMWAQHHRAAGSAGCPDYSPSFVRGCLGAMGTPGR